MKRSSLILIGTALVFSQTPAFGFGSKPPEQIEKPAPTPKPPVVVDVAAGRAKILSIATGSKCSKEYYTKRGTPPKSYMKGIALTYVKAICNPDSDTFKIASQALGNAKDDALTHYGLKPTTAQARLNLTFSLMVGSGGRESSWVWCEGRDVAAKNVTGEKAESGLYQTSWNSRSAHPALLKLYKEYVEYPNGCFENEYRGTKVCDAAKNKNWGTGEGVIFQAVTKECPSFAGEYHAIMLRVRRNHYGPINRKTSELKATCTDMFEELRLAVVADPNLCHVL